LSSVVYLDSSALVKLVVAEAESEALRLYAATKAGVEALTHVLANELRGRNITVNSVAPGPDRDRALSQGQTARGRGASAQARPARASG
jgi:3-oxoacyl-[acyl-carrier protein] reductase